MLDIEVHEIRGHCPVHDVGDKIVVEGPQIDLEKTDNLCTHALESFLHYTTALEKGVSPVELGLNKDDEKSNENEAYLQCLDPGKEYTDGGTVIFKIQIE